MATIPQKIVERYKRTIPKYQKILKNALDRDLNEADTVAICQDMLSEIFGFEKYLEITSEYAIRGTFCDLAIKYDEKIQYLIEVKAIGITLKDNHMKQAIDYGANKGVNWVVLTNGIVWEIYKVIFERPIDHQLVCTLNILDINTRKSEDHEKLFLLSKKGITRSARDDYYEKIQSINRFVIGAILLNNSVLKEIKKDIRKISPGIKVETDEIEKILKNEVLKRDVIEGEEAVKAFSKVHKLINKISRRSKQQNKQKSKTTPDDAEII